MHMLVISAAVTAGLFWWLVRMERDSAWRLPAMAALGASSLWLVWGLVELAPLRAQPEPAWVRAPAAAQPDQGAVPGPASAQPPRLAIPGLPKVRISVLLLVIAVVLAAWPVGHWAKLVLRTVLSVLVFCAGVLLLLGVGFAVMWSNGRDWPFLRADAVMLVLATLLSAVTTVRLRVADKAPMTLDAHRGANRRGNHRVSSRNRSGAPGEGDGPDSQS
jgi:hypothetical protein